MCCHIVLWDYVNPPPPFWCCAKSYHIVFWVNLPSTPVGSVLSRIPGAVHGRRKSGPAIQAGRDEAGVRRHHSGGMG